MHLRAPAPLARGAGLIRRPLASLRGRAARALRELRIRAGQPRRAPILPLTARPPLAAGAGAFQAERAWSLLLAQCALGPRAPGSAGHRACREWLVERLHECSGEVAAQPWRQRVYRGAGAGTWVPLCNLFARIPGREPGPPGMMLAAHWDTRPLADQDPDPALRARPVPGANDGASGVAVLLEAARALCASPPRRDVLIALFDGEDLGDHYYGSRLFARTLTDRWRPRQAVVVDMVGKRGLSCAREVQSLRGAPRLWARVEAAARAEGLAQLLSGPAQVINDDHVSLQRAGIPAVLLIDYAYPEWHTTRDTAERCDAASLEAVGRVLVRLCREEG